MQFAKKAWRLLVAVKDGLVLIFLLMFFGVLYMALTSTPSTNTAKGGALLLKLNGSIVEQYEGGSAQDVLLGNVAQTGQTLLRDVIHGLETASKDDTIKAVVLDLDSFWGGGQASMIRIGGAIEAVKKSGKPVFTYATGYGDDGYLLAAHASEIWLNPLGATMIAGPGGSQPYFKGLIDRLGVNARVYRVGKYKSFVEPYILAAQSPESKAANEALYASLWTQWQDAVVKARPNAQIKAYAASPTTTMLAGPNMAEAARTQGIVDKIGDRIAFSKRVAEVVGRDEDTAADQFKSTALEDYVMLNPPSYSGAQIGILTVAGTIVDGEASSGTAGGDTLSTLVLEALAKGDLKALVIRVNSPGGSAFASEQIRLAIAQAKAKNIPVITSMGDVAASGGYWVAMAGDKVFAEPSTLTGSIGVFGVIPTFENAIGKAGITSDGVRTTPLSGQPDILGGINKEGDAVIQRGVEDIYNRFLTLVATNRKMTIQKVDEAAQGRVWDGTMAKQLNLIDAFGSLDDAVAEAAKRAKLDPKSVTRVYLEPETPSLLKAVSQFLSVSAKSQPRDIFSQSIAKQQAQAVTGLQDATQVLTGPVIQVRCLSCPRESVPVDTGSFFKRMLGQIFS
jgi:protease IV